MLPTTRNALTYQLAKFNGFSQHNDVTGNIDELRSFIFTFYMSGCYREFWEKLKDEDKDEFNKQISSFIFAYLTGITPVNARLLIALYDNNQIHELSGLTDITFDDTKHKFLLHFKDGKINECTYLIDSSGLGYDVSRSHPNFPLLNNLISHGYLVPRKYGGILLNDCGQMINQDNQVQRNLFCIGPIASYGHPFPTPYASFIAIDAVEKALMALSRNLLLGNEVNLSEFKVAR